jgi:hypothetical protein
MRVFLDANVLFSAAKSERAVRALLRLFFSSVDMSVGRTPMSSPKRDETLRPKGPQA